MVQVYHVDYEKTPDNPHLEQPHTKLRNPLCARDPCRPLSSVRAMCPCQARPGSGTPLSELGISGLQIFFLRGRAVTDNKSDDLGCMRAVSTLVFFLLSSQQSQVPSFRVPYPPSRLLRVGLSGRSLPAFFHTQKPKNKVTMSPPMAAAREKESNLARLLGSGRSQLEPSRSFGGIGVDSLFAGSAGIAELAIFHPVRSPDDLRLQNSDVRPVRDGKWGADELVTDRSIPLRSAS